ncbi:hypothetical protein A2X44_04705 [candidate division CPR3 bacterium GWF2_35_18]|uniref:GH18 domain-containing protein n=1 Tax=candidate division CPR3 bacterium GW2011_GWF2_35_18 TaxID=1618350 RepID=A0A0G0E398_UNCC3|nr:MAG: hypothetical protein UR67_C0003G0023 [candidate division CPR3 bacterium GW2011_GWF2_35_18]KKP86209.1 MAG: hypothetical protein UR87_C0026G0011 [candidate division CPR3 bacterium GW2011_GWE2_35_7]OGB63634.1 MAG: hypothetical protein A2X44_04705 [candidate division CPR3 bacterium GWF2_35_18]OGB64171.1 MAG: hypothetical protein A2250_02540 [candidate division CPR3 bacterium RIFOXYA2_FULL_35_13]OGB76482.1 MAG: hypothetical protein A2476_05045 [candidate division CPR3 bacterium RIFOXYC2_FULL
MKTLPKLLLIFFIIFLFSIIIGEGYLLFSNKGSCPLNFCYLNSSQSESESELEKIRNIEKQAKKIEEIQITGWIPDWDFQDGFNSLRTQKDTFSSISPFWYDLNEDGSLEPNASTNNEEFIQFVKNNNIELIPTITTFNADTLSSMLNSIEYREKHLNEIIQIVTRNNYDGIDLDYESVYLDDDELFYNFLETLALILHENNKKLVFTAVSKWGEEDILYTTLPQTRKTFDYKRLAKITDELRIMTYDYTNRTSIYYGPVSPIAWVEDVIRYAIYVGVPREKLVIGIPTYAFDFTERPALPKIEYYPVLYMRTGENLKEASAYYYDEIKKVTAAYDFEVEFNDYWGEAIGKYTNDNDENHIVVFQNQESIDLRKKLAADYGIKGVTYWRIGDEVDLRY